jgi:hypothetical protein
MGDLIGPFDQWDWQTLKDIKGSLNFYQSEPDGYRKYKDAIRKERNLFTYCLEPFINN